MVRRPFLTRSGILADFSVHSFVDLGITGWLVFYIFAILAIAAYLLISRSKKIPVPYTKKNKETSVVSRDFVFAGRDSSARPCLNRNILLLYSCLPNVLRAQEKGWDGLMDAHR